MPLRRGFKSWCETVATQQRKNLGLVDSEPLDPKKLALYMGTTILKAEEVPGVEKDVLRTLLHDDADSWSAITLGSGNRHLIVINSSHVPGRTSSDVMHELSHILIGHKPTRIDISEDDLLMLQFFEGEQEQEANCLAETLLLPRQALLRIRREGLDDSSAAKRYFTTPTMLKYRMNITGLGTARRNRSVNAAAK